MRAIAAAALLALASPAAAQQGACKPLPLLLLQMSAEFGETPVMKGVIDGGQAYVILLVNPQKDTFSIVNVNPQGIACLMQGGSGLEWDYYKPPGYPT